MPGLLQNPTETGPIAAKRLILNASPIRWPSDSPGLWVGHLTPHGRRLRTPPQPIVIVGPNRREKRGCGASQNSPARVNRLGENGGNLMRIPVPVFTLLLAGTTLLAPPP